MSVRVTSGSRLRFSDLVSVDGTEFWNASIFPEIEAQADETQYTIVETDRIDLLAYRFYGDPSLWWVLALANGWELVPSDLNVGAVIRVPSKPYVDQVLFAKSNQSA